RSWSRNRPPSENESGVILRMPMTSGRRSASSAARVPGPGCCWGLSLRSAGSARAVGWAWRGLGGAVKQASAQETGTQQADGGERHPEADGGVFATERREVQHLKAQREHAT